MLYFYNQHPLQEEPTLLEQVVYPLPHIDADSLSPLEFVLKQAESNCSTSITPFMYLEQFKHMLFVLFCFLLVGPFTPVQAQVNQKLFTWGGDYHGQLGNGNSGLHTLPIQTTVPSKWLMVSAGVNHTLGIKPDGTLWAWGDNYFGQLGDGTNMTGFHFISTAPVQIGNDADWKFVSAGNSHSMAIKNDGTLWAWGSNSVGQLGTGSSSTVPIQVGTDANWASVSGHNTRHTLAIKTDGTLWAWGNNIWGQLGDGTRIQKNVPTQIGTSKEWVLVEAGYEHSLAIKSDGSLWAWGYNSESQLGDGTTTRSEVPIQVGNSTDWKAVSAGSYHNLGIKNDGTLWGWGFNFQSQLGDGTRERKRVPVQIGNDKDWSSIEAGFEHGLAIKSDGSLWGWGDNYSGQVGDGTQTDKRIPTQISTANDWALVTAGYDFSLAMKSDGTLWAWGSDKSGQFGNGVIKPAQIGNSTDWISLSAGEYFNLAIRGDGTLWTWGNNVWGQLGDGTTTSKSVPVQIGYASDWAAVSAGKDHSVAIKRDGTLWTWGYNSSGQLGNGSTAGRLVPSRIGSDTDWSSVAAGEYHNLAIKENGTLWAWGENGNGQLGDGTTERKYAPVQVGSATDWASLDAGLFHNLAIKQDGTLWAWGYNMHGQLGIGARSGSYVPVQVGSATNWAIVSAGNSHSAAIDSNGTLWAWGENRYGQLGSGDRNPANVPMQIGLATDWLSVKAGDFNTLAINSDGSLWAWGSNAEGKLGDGTFKQRDAPVLVDATTHWVSLETIGFHSLALLGEFSRNANLANLVISAGGLAPAFYSRTRNYEVTVEVPSISVTPTVAHPSATVTVNGVALANGNASPAIPLKFGDNLITVVVTAQDGKTTQTYTLLVKRINAAPVLEAIGAKTVDELKVLNFRASAADSDPEHSLAYSLVGAPAGATIDASTGVFSWTPTEAQGPGSFVFKVRATDNGNPALYDEEQITVTVAEVNVAPVLAAIPEASISCGGNLTFTASATDVDLPLNTLRYSFSGDVPAGAGIDAATGAFNWTPAAEQLGPHQFIIRVTDSGVPALYHEQSFTLRLEDQQPPIVLTQDLTVILDADGAASITAEEIDKGSTDNCGIASFHLDKTSFNCEQLGPNTVTLTVTDKAGNAATATARVTVESAETKLAPVAVGEWVSKIAYSADAAFAINEVSGASGYHWSVPAGFRVTSGQNTTAIRIQAISGSASGNLSVKAKYSCGEGEALTYAISTTKASANVTISQLNHEYTGEAKSVVVTTEPAGLAVEISYNSAAELPVEVGEYTVSAVINDDNYAGEASAMLLISEPTALTDPAVRDAIMLYPNPTTGKVLLKVENGAVAQLIVLSLQGKLISQATASGNYELNLEGFPAGVYLIRVLQKDGATVMLKLHKL